MAGPARGLGKAMPVKRKTAAKRTPSARRKPAARRQRWSQQVTENSHALDLEKGVFTLADPAEIARSLKRSADSSGNRKTTPFRSAMSMLNFYLNRAGRKLPKERRQRLDAAKEELRVLYGRSP